MRTITTYQCEGCGKKFTERYAAVEHEAECYNIPLDEMKAWAYALNNTRDWDRAAGANAYLDRFYEKYKTSRGKMPYYYEPYIYQI